MTGSTMAHLAQLHQLALERGGAFPRRRALFEQLQQGRGRHFVGIVGPRGVGKTVLLQQLALADSAAFYLAADTLEGEDLFEVALRLRKDYRIATLLVDEIHHCPDHAATLKKLFDFADLRVFFSSSVSLALFESAEDLSRRVRLLRLLPFSYREYLSFVHGQELPALSLEEIARGKFAAGHLLAGTHFEPYLRGGLMPFSLDEPEPLALLEGIRDRVVARDLAAAGRLPADETATVKRLLRFVGRSEVDGISYSSLARNLGITKYKAEAYCSLLERAFVLTRVLPAGTNVLREPKVLLRVPYRLLYREFDDALGGLREDATVEMLQSAGHRCEYLKSTRGAKTPDFLVRLAGQPMVIEVGGRGKGRSQFKGIKVERKLIFAHGDRTDGNYRPLHLLGFL